MVKLWEHQEQMVSFAIRNFNDRGYAFWVAGCRTGKTIAALQVASQGGMTRTLVLTKKAAISSAWEQDIIEHFPFWNYVLMDTTIKAKGAESKARTSAKKAKFLTEYQKDKPNLLVVVNYETARLIAPVLNKLNFDLVIADESHALKSHNSKTSVTLAKSLRDVPYKLNMTGTSWSDRPTDIFGQDRFLANTGKGRYPASLNFGSWGQFFERHVDYYMMNNIKVPKGYKNLELINETINPYTMIINTEDVLDLPPTLDIEIRLDMPKQMRQAYSDLEEQMIAELGESLVMADNRLVQGLRLHQLTGGYFVNPDGELLEYLEDKDNPKLQALLEIVDEIDNQPLVVFTRFKHDVVLIERALKAKGIDTRKLVGGTYEHVEWQKGDGQVLIANIQAGGTGVTLSRARYVVYYSVGNSNTDYEQSTWRVRDNNSDKDNPIAYHHLIMRGTVDEEIRYALANKKEMSEFLLNGLTARIKHDTLSEDK